MMAKIGVIFMPFSNPTCCFRETADLTHLQSLVFQFDRKLGFWTTLVLLIPDTKIQYLFILTRTVLDCLNLLIHCHCFLRKTYANTRGLFCRFKLSFTKRDLGSILFINLITTYFGAFGIEKKHPFVILEVYLILFTYLVTHKNVSPQNTAFYINYFTTGIALISV